MSPQPIKQAIAERYNLDTEKPVYTLLVDGNSMLEVAFSADDKINGRNEHIGGIFQFLLQLKIILAKRDFDYIYVFWDGDNSGEYRARIYPEYKANRDKHYNLDGVESDYYKQIDKFTKRVLEKSRKATSPEKIDRKEKFHRQRNVLFEYLEELFIRQVMCDKIEGDDLIAYYCLNKKPNDRIYIMSGDRDITQLLDIDNYICIYIPVIKKFITTQNFKAEFGYHQQNVLLKKILCGDSSDNIKGIKGLGEKTLYDMMPEIKERKVSLNEVIDKCDELINERVNQKKKPLVVHQNIKNQVSDGINDGRVFEINEKIINLKKPILSDDAKEMIDSLMYNPIDSEGRNMSNLYKMIVRDDILDLIDDNRFSTFFSTFNKTIEKEKNMFEKWKNNVK